MSAYVIGHLHNPTINEDVIEYIDRIQATMDPFGGRFLVHGVEAEVKEGEWPGAVVIVEFPDRDALNAWYDSPAYREILPLRTNHIDSSLVFVDGVPPNYDPTRTAAALRKLIS